MTLQELKTKEIKKGSKDVASFIISLYNDSSKTFLKQQRDWYINERFARGEHWIVYNKTLNKIQPIPVSDGEIRRTVNKIRAQIRGVKNFIKRNQPRWEVHPDDITDAALKEAQSKNKLIQNVYRTRKFPGILTDQIVNAMKYSFGIIEGGVIKKDGKDYLDFWVDDTFDIVFDPSATCVQNARFIVKTIKKPITSIKNEYDVKNIGSDNKEAASEYKELLEREKYSQGGNKSNEDLETAIVYEFWLKWIEGDKVKIKVITCVVDQVLRVYEPNYRRYPFFGYSLEKNANSIYGDAWIKDLISLNKSLDKTVSQVESYIQRMLAGKYLIKQGVEVSSITDKGAEKIYYKGSVPPIQQQLQPLPAAPFTYINTLERFIEELGGIREASLGRVPSSIQSGKGIEALQAADASTVAEPIENLELELEEIGEFILEIISDYQVASEEIVEDNQKIKYIGDVANVPPNVIVIKPSQVKVVIVPEIAYTEDARMERLMQLVSAGVIDPQTVLEKLSISNIGDIIQRMQKIKDEDFKQEMIKQKESHRSEGQGPEDAASLADQENVQMLSGQDVPMTPQALWVPEHLSLHMSFLQENRQDIESNPTVKELFEAHINNESSYAQ